MSEYQYYEFRTIGRTLSEKERKEVDKWSSHGNTTNTSFSVTYNYGDFRYNPSDCLNSHFDAFLYITNYGNLQIGFKFLTELIDQAAIEPYCVRNRIELLVKGNYTLLMLDFSTEDSEDFWIDGEVYLAQLLPLYDQLLNGDYRFLYIAWLHANTLSNYNDDYYYEDEDEDEDNDDNDIAEPPIPANLQKLDSANIAFCNLLNIDEDIVSVAATKSIQSQADTNKQVQIELLPDAEKISFLQRLLDNEPFLSAKLLKRLKELSPTPTSDNDSNYTKARTLADILTEAQNVKENRLKQAAEKAAQEHTEAMKALEPKADKMWQDALHFISDKRVSGYNVAMPLLVSLKELAIYQNKLAEFTLRIQNIVQQYPKLTGLHDRLRQNKLM